jgi:AcrR family transcriptional regulator
MSREEARRDALLDAALGVFARFGFRKTSMDEVARAAQISRQGLYLHFPTKEDLFRATVQHILGRVTRGVTEALADPALTLEARLVRVFDESVGRYVGLFAPGSDLAEASNALVGPMVVEHQARLLDAVARALRSSGLMAAYKGLTARQLAETLEATARGLKYTSGSREAFVRGMTVAVKAMCAPLARDA